MAADPETLLFARFRDEADVGALGQLYDLTAAELLRVAFHLVRDPARAEDLVQQTFVAAIEGANRFDAERSVRGWLLGILANQARKLQRTEARVPPPGADAAIDPLDEVQTHEFTAAVDAAISTMPEVYQPVLVLHLKHGMIAAEIAHALRRPPGTVRTQLVRALELLKKALPPSIAVGACVLLTPLRGLAAVKQVVLGTAAHHVAAAASVAGGTAGAVATASLVGGTLVMKKVIAAIACAVVLCIGAFVLLESNRAAANTTDTRDTAALVQAPLATRPELPMSPQPAADTQRELQLTPTHGSLRYRFLWEEDRTPAVGVFVHFVVWGRQNPMFFVEEPQTDHDGEIALVGLEPGRVGIYVDRAGGASPTIVAGEESTGIVLIPRGVTVDVAVQDEQQQPIPGARVWLSHYGNHTEGHEVGATTAAGRATIRDVDEARQIGARADGYVPTDLVDVKGKPGDRIAITLTMSSGGATLRGVVRDVEARPVPGARLWISGFSRHTKGEPGMRLASPPAPFELRADANGVFEALGLPAEQVTLRARAAASGTSLQRVELRAGETTRVDVVLPTGASIAGFVRDEEGRGIAGAWIGGGSAYGDFGYCNTLSAADGAFVLQGLTPQQGLSIGVSLDPYLPASETFRLAAGERRSVDFVLKASRSADQISGILVDSNDAPLAKWVVEIRSRDEQTSWNAWLHTDADGRFVARGCREQRCRLQVFERDGEGVPFPLVAMDVECGTRDLRVCVPASALQRATISGRCVDADGKPVVEANVSVHQPGLRTFRSWETDASGRFRTDPLSPRTYRLDVSGHGLPIVRLGERELAPNLDLDLGTIVLPRGGRVALRCTGAAAERQWWASIRTKSNEWVSRLDETTEPRQSDLLAPGRYELIVGGNGIAAVARDIEITDGRTTNVEIALERGARHSIELRGPKDGWQTSKVVVSDATGNHVCIFEALPAANGCSLCLGTGTWQVAVKSDTGLTGTATIHVADVAVEPKPVVVDLR